MILTSNRGFAEWGKVFGDPVVATALLDRLLHHAVVVHIEGASYRLRQHADLVPESLRPPQHANATADAPRPQRSQERTHFCSPELTRRVRIGLWSVVETKRYPTCSKAIIPLFDRRDHSSAPTWVPPRLRQPSVNDGRKATARLRGAQRH